VPSPRDASRTLASLAVLLLLTLGLTATTANAVDYPLPTTGVGQVSSSTVEAGTCVTFSGGGFAPNTPVAIADNGKVVGNTVTDSSGSFSSVACFSTSATLGKHTLTASGVGANGAGRVVSAKVTVIGAQLSGSGFQQPVTVGTVGTGADGSDGAGTGSHQGSGSLPFTGSDVRDLALFGLFMVALGALLTRRGRAARKQRRAARAAL
jgi:hypothetical protein